MDLRQYVAALRKGWWIIVIAIILGTAAGAFVNFRATPQYASTVTFFISTPTGRRNVRRWPPISSPPGGSPPMSDC